MEEDWHPGRCSSSAAKKHVSELIRESCQPTWAPREVLPFQVSGAPNRQLAAKTEEGPSELELGLVGQICCLDALAVDQRAVLGPKVPNRPAAVRSEEHTSELQSHLNLVCRLLLEKKKQTARLPRSTRRVSCHYLYCN